MTTNAVTLENIVTFITTDPLNVGFSAILAAHPGESGPLAEAANQPDGTTVPGDPISPADLGKMISSDEWGLLTTTNHLQLQTLNTQGVIDMGDENIQGILGVTFAACPKSLAAMGLKFTRPASAWEAYFGVGQVATPSMLDDARNLPPGNPRF